MASAPIWPASTARMRSASSVPRPSDAAIDCGVRISAHHQRPVRRRPRARPDRSRPVDQRARSADRGERRGTPQRGRQSHGGDRAHRGRRARRAQRGTTSSPAATPMALSSRMAMRHVEGGRAMATVEPWWGITIAAAGGGANPGIRPIRRAGARRRRCAPRLATASSTASPRIRCRVPEEGLTALPGAPDNCAG